MKKHVDPAEVDILAIWANTPLALVHDILLKGEFAPAPAEPIAENEKVLGEMTPLEKAIYTAACNIADSNNAMIKEFRDKGEKPDMLTVVQNRINHAVLEELLWASARYRFGAYEGNPNSIALREGDKIVECPSKKSSEGLINVVITNDPFMMMAASMMADLAGEKDK